MFGAILIVLILPIVDVSRIRSNGFKPISKFFYWLFIGNFFLLGWIGGNHAEEPFITIGQICTIYYFAYFIIIVPMISRVENVLMDLGTFKLLPLITFIFIIFSYLYLYYCLSCIAILI